MTVVTSYTELLSELRGEFNRETDTTSPFDRFIHDAESALRRDKR